MRRSPGIISVVALLLLVVLTTLGISLATLTNTSFLKADNFAKVQSARMEAESGLAFTAFILQNCAVAPNTSGQALLDSLANQLGSVLDGTGNLQGGTIAYDSEMVTIPSITIGNGRSFSARVSLLDPTVLHVVVTGQNRGITRTVGIDCDAVPDGEVFFSYGVASKSAVSMTGNAKILGANSPSEASVLSATSSTNEAINMAGNSQIEGDVYFPNPAAYASMSGSASIGGQDNGSATLGNHIHSNIGTVEFPEVDPNELGPFATNIVDSDTVITGNLTFNNIRIAANTNPTFSGNIEINGVVFIEAPNQVHFSGNLNLTGLIVTEDAGDDVYDVNTIKFTGNTNIQSVEALPDTPDFHELREKPGSFLLAPGFGAEFSGNFGTINGTMAADEFKFSGNATGIVKGSIINYSDSEFRLTGNASITIDRSGTPEIPPGFSLPSTFTLAPDSYLEY